jgi:hypothetical protein
MNSESESIVQAEVLVHFMRISWYLPGGKVKTNLLVSQQTLHKFYHSESQSV